MFLAGERATSFQYVEDEGRMEVNMSLRLYFEFPLWGAIAPKAQQYRRLPNTVLCTLGSVGLWMVSPVQALLSTKLTVDARKFEVCEDF